MVVFSLPEYNGACIYLILSPNNKPYTGQTVAFLDRMSSHKSNGKLAWIHHAEWQAGKHRKVSAISFAIHKHGWENMRIIILEKFSEWDQALLDEREKHFIRVYDSLKNGYNSNEGGNGGGHPCSEEAKAKIGTANSKPVTSCEIKKLYSDGTQLVEFVSYSSTIEAERQTGVYHSDISKCCKKRQNTAGGRYWHFTKEDELEGTHRVPTIGDIPSRYKQALFSESPEGEKQRHESANAAARYLLESTGKKFYKGNISACCRGKRKTHCGYKFYYA